MKKIYITLILCITVFMMQAQTFDFSVSYVGINGGTNNYQMALVATPSASVTNGVTADMGAGFYLPSGLTIGNFAEGDSGIPASDWSSFALGSNASGDGIYLSRVEAGAMSTVLNGADPFQLVLFDVIADPNPTSGSITLMENGDALLVNNFVENYIEINLGGGTANAYNQNNPVANSVDFATLAINDNKLVDYNVSIYPNPTRGNLTIETNKSISYSIFNILGQSVKLTGKLESGANKSISLSHLPDGIYILKAEDEDNNSKSFKIIKKE